MTARRSGHFAHILASGLGALLMSGCSLSGNSGSSSSDLTAQCTLPPAGLITWWRGEGNANDSVGAINGTSNSGVSFAPGKIGSGFVFDGVSGYTNMSVIQGTALDPQSADFSVMLWVQTVQEGSSTYLILGNADFGQAPGFRILYQPQVNHQLRFRVADSTTAVIVDSAPVNDGQWHFVAFTRHGTDLSAYTDGILNAGTVGPYAVNVDTSAQFNLGGRNTDEFFQGSIDEIAVFNQTIAAADIAAVYASGAQGICH